MSGVVTERVVSYWAVQGDRWCNVNGMLTESNGLVDKFAKDGWRVVTRVTEREVPVFGELEERDE